MGCGLFQKPVTSSAKDPIDSGYSGVARGLAERYVQSSATSIQKLTRVTMCDPGNALSLIDANNHQAIPSATSTMQCITSRQCGTRMYCPCYAPYFLICSQSEAHIALLNRTQASFTSWYALSGGNPVAPSMSYTHQFNDTLETQVYSLLWIEGIGQAKRVRLIQETCTTACSLAHPA